jgi:hypothetical protein
MWQAVVDYLKPPPSQFRPSLFRRKGKFYEPIGQDIKIKFYECCGQLFFIIDNPSFSLLDVRISVDSSYVKNEMSITRRCNNSGDPYCVIEIPSDMIDGRPKKMDTVIYIGVRTVWAGKNIVQSFTITFESSE